MNVFDAFSCRRVEPKPAVWFAQGLSEQQKQITAHHRSVAAESPLTFARFLTVLLCSCRPELRRWSRERGNAEQSGFVFLSRVRVPAQQGRHAEPHTGKSPQIQLHRKCRQRVMSACGVDRRFNGWPFALQKASQPHLVSQWQENSDLSKQAWPLMALAKTLESREGPGYVQVRSPCAELLQQILSTFGHICIFMWSC